MGFDPNIFLAIVFALIGVFQIGVFVNSKEESSRIVAITLWFFLLSSLNVNIYLLK